MGQPRLCHICNHPRVVEADRALASGRRQSEVAKLLGVSKYSVSRHVLRGHVGSMPPNPLAPPPAPPSGPDSDPTASLQRQLNVLEGMSEQGLTTNQLFQLYEQRRKAAEALQKAQPALDAEGPAQRQLQAVMEMKRVEDEVLERHPEVRAEIAAALQAWRAARGRPEEAGEEKAT